MIARIAAWAIVAVILGALWQYGGSFSSPWAKATQSPLAGQLPAAHTGCTEKCR